MDLTKVDFKPILDSAKSSEDGLAVFLRTIQPYVMNKARYILGSNEAAEDIYQNVSLKLYNNLDHIDSRGFMSYLKRTVTNACNDELRKGHKLTDDGEEVKLVSLDEYEDWDIPAEDQTFDLTEDYRNTVVNEVIDSLPENQREVIVLRYMDDLKIRDIANELNVNENTIKSRLNLAYKKIEQQINMIQKRDGIRLHSYTPIMFFLMLFKRGEGAYVGDILKPMEIASEIYGVLKGTNIVAEGIKHVAGEAASKTIPTPPPAPTPPAAPVPMPDPATTVGVGGKALGSLTVGKVAAGVAAASVALTGGYYAVNHFNDFVLLKDPVTTEDFETVEEEIGTPEEVGAVRTIDKDAIGYITLGDYNVNIRREPNVDSNAIGKAYPGDTYRVYDMKEEGGYTWYCINYDFDRNSWIANDGTWMEYSESIPEELKGSYLEGSDLDPDYLNHIQYLSDGIYVGILNEFSFQFTNMYQVEASRPYSCIYDFDYDEKGNLYVTHYEFQNGQLIGPFTEVTTLDSDHYLAYERYNSELSNYLPGYFNIIWQSSNRADGISLATFRDDCRIFYQTSKAYDEDDAENWKDYTFTAELDRVSNMDVAKSLLGQPMVFKAVIDSEGGMGGVQYP